MAQPLRTLGLYVHAPFCVHKCGYCDFNSWAEERREPMLRWAEALRRQIGYWAPRVRAAGYTLDTVFWGGGTPSLLPNDVLVDIGARIRSNFALTPGYEWSVECNPETLDSAKLAALHEMGATRLSMGLQSFRDEQLERLERRARREHNLRALELVTKEWGKPWSGDLMFGLPDQTPEQWSEDLELLIGFGPTHVSAYQLTLTTERSKSWRQPPEEALLRLFDETERRCEAAGLKRYEVSNFARPGFECRHNLRYWRLEPFLGLGPGAAGLLPPPLTQTQGFGAHQRNAERFETWESVAGTPKEELTLTARSPLEHAEEIFLMGLRLPGGVDLGRFGPARELLEEGLQTLPFRGLLEVSGPTQIPEKRASRVQVTPRGLRVLDSLLPKIFNILSESGKLSTPNLDLAHFDTKFAGMSEFTEKPSETLDTNASVEEPASDTAAQDAAKLQEAALEEWKGKVAYLAAEIENMRKRFVREKSDVVKFANEELVKMILPVVDNLFLAVKAMKDAEPKLDASIRENTVVANLFKGVDMTLKHFETTLEQVGVKAIAAEGQNFDPLQHEAIGQSANADQPDNQVGAVVQRGWTLSGRVIRPARVIVNKLSS